MLRYRNAKCNSNSITEISEYNTLLMLKTKIVYDGQIFITYLCNNIKLADLQNELMSLCGLKNELQFTVKWIDPDGDPCTISSQQELDECMRLCSKKKSREIFMHIFNGNPLKPGYSCEDESQKVYKNKAKRWKKYYKINGHTFEVKRLNKKAFCAHCNERIWGIGRQGCKCLACRIVIHKKCYKLTKIKCNHDSYKNTRLNCVNECRESKSGAKDIKDELCRALQTVKYCIPNQRDLKSTFCSKDELSISDCEVSEKINVSQIIGGIVPKKSKSVSFEDFNIIRVIGRGTFSKVLMVESKEEHKLYAMKVVRKLSLVEDEDIEWVKIEKNVFEIATNHPFLVGLHSCFQTPSRLYYVIEFVQGGDLMFHMQRKGRLQENHALFYSAEVAIALNFLHQNGIIYRDLKLDNVLLANDGHIKLTDYGMCKQGIRGNIKTSTFCGTPNYMAPELLRNEDYSFSVDWWALGVMMFEMMVGNSPFLTDQLKGKTEDYLFQIILTSDIKPPNSLSSNSKRVLYDFLMKDPSKRLGCKVGHGFKEIMNHVYYSEIDWDALERKQIKAPFIPTLDNNLDFDNFPTEFTSEPLEFSFDDQYEVSKIDQDEFSDFGYVNPLMAFKNCD